MTYVILTDRRRLGHTTYVNEPTDRYEIVDAVMRLRDTYRENGYQTPDTVNLVKVIDGDGLVRYEVRHQGVLLGWTRKAARGWVAHVVVAIGLGKQIDIAGTRTEAVGEIVWAAGSWDSARQIASRHTQLIELGVSP